MVELHHNEICAALRHIVQGLAPLTADPEGDLLTVGSNRLFHLGETVTLVNTQGDEEEHSIVELPGLTQIRLDSPVRGDFRVAAGGRLRSEEGGLEDLQWVGQGLPEIMPQPPENMLPCIIVQPGRLEQPLSEGTNRGYQQNYHCRIHYLHPARAGEAASQELLEQAARLFRRLMSDPYVGGTAWYAQVVRLEPEPESVRRMRDKGFPVVGVEVEMVAQRLEVGGG
ncbi:MAG: hypothetical protein GX100_13420 [candidate division WS1 bacterium]|nr:hypothetical protein [candidate division WS1 bacterium]